MVRTEVQTIFYVFRDDIIMAVRQAFPRSITSHLSKTQGCRAPIFILFLSYCCNWGKVTSTLIAIRWTIEHKIRIFIIVKLVIERHIGENFGLFHEGKILLVRASKVKKEQPHQDEGDDRNIFSEKVHDGEAEIQKYNGKELELLLFSSNQFTVMEVS